MQLKFRHAVGIVKMVSLQHQNTAGFEHLYVF